jgi:hypothetical protein
MFGSISLSNPAPTLPPDGLRVSLFTDSVAIYFSPPFLSIAPGDSSATIIANTNPVAHALVATVTGTLGTQRIHRRVTVLPPSITRFEYAPGSAPGYQYPPEAPYGSLILSRPAPSGGLRVSIVSSEPALVVPVPDEVFIAEGLNSPVEEFYLQVNPVAVNTYVTLTATTSGAAATFAFEILGGGPSHIVVSSLTLAPATVIGGTTTFAHFALASPVGPEGASIAVESSDPTVATVPPTVPLASGARGGSFAVHTRALHPPVARRHCTIIAARDGTPANALLTVTS